MTDVKLNLIGEKNTNTISIRVNFEYLQFLKTLEELFNYQLTEKDKPQFKIEYN